MSARSEILSNVRAALRASGRHCEHEIPREYTQSTGDEPGSAPVVDQFVEALEDYKAFVVKAKADQVPNAIAAFLVDDQSVVVPTGLDKSWKEAAGRDGREVFEDSRQQQIDKLKLNEIDTVVTASRVAISQTGTIVLDGTEDQGRRAISLVPDHHICVVKQSTVMPTVPQAAAVLDPHSTRPLTWIAGPSATSDIELVRVDGVHGPRRLSVIVVTDQ